MGGSNSTGRISHLVVLGHPSPDSFNASIARRYAEAVQANYHTATTRDLYALDFDPRLKERERVPGEGTSYAHSIEAELGFLNECDVITFVYPLWFGMPPAIIKGYLDRVFGAGFRLNHLKGERAKLFEDKQLAVISTSASTRPWLESHGMWISLRQSFENYLKTLFGFSKSYHYHADSITDDLSQAEAERVFFEVEQFARTVCAEAASSMRTR